MNLADGSSMPLANRKGIKMKIICFAVGSMLAATAAVADEISIVSNILGPGDVDLLIRNWRTWRWLSLRPASNLCRPRHSLPAMVGRVRPLADMSLTRVISDRLGNIKR
jgi:hypothetical protein